MAISFNNAFGIHIEALAVRQQRAQLIAENLANVDTHDFKARDLDFRALLGEAEFGRALDVATTHKDHIPVAASTGGIDGALYRHPVQPSLDGNTVDSQIEESAFAQNALRYQASLQFLSGRIQQLRLALRGE